MVLASSSLAVGPAVIVPVIAVLVLTAREMLLLTSSGQAARAVRVLTVVAWPATAAAALVLLLRFLQLI